LPFADRPKELGDLDRCRFLEASAADLAALQELSVDVTTTRAVLIYVEAKQQAFDEFFRVLRPGGRISLYEPINRFGHVERDEELLWFYPVDGLGELAARIAAVYTDLQPPEADRCSTSTSAILCGMLRRRGSSRSS
jgi:ubiquinone/menaquinone biosynthesis C-methylase UbiE